MASPCPARRAPSAPGPSVLVWQLCIQMRCPSYLHWHRITLLEKSDSATSCLGFTTTWGGEGQGWGHHCHALARQGCGMHRGVQSSTPMCRVRRCWWCPQRMAPSPEL